MRTPTEKFNYAVCAIEESKDTDEITIDELQSSLILHEQKFKTKEVEEQVLRTCYEGLSGGRAAFRGKRWIQRQR